MKIKNLVLIASFTAISQFAFAQPSFNMRRSPGDSLREEGNILGAIEEYRKVYLMSPKNQVNVYNYACVLSINRQIDSSFKYLNIAVELDTSTAPFTDPDFLTIREDKKWVVFENRLISMLNKKYNNPYKDTEFAKALWKMMAFDQSYFDVMRLAAMKIGRRSSVDEALQNFKNMINHNNQKALEDLIAQKGWPRISEVGSTAAGAAFYVIQHSDAEKQKKYIPMLKKRCEEKEANWLHYAMLYDRLQMNLNLPQRYGTQMNLDNIETGEYELYKLEDETKVSEWRREIGLPPIKTQ